MTLDLTMCSLIVCYSVAVTVSVGTLLDSSNQRSEVEASYIEDDGVPAGTVLVSRLSRCTNSSLVGLPVLPCCPLRFL